MAAAFAALVSLQNNLDLIQNHPRHLFSFAEKQIQLLGISVSFLIFFMKKSHGNSYGARKEALERRIACAAQAAEGVIESHVVDQILSGKTTTKIAPPRFLLDLQKVTEDMEYIEREAFNAYKREVEKSGMEVEQQYSTTSSTSDKTFNTTTVVGFDGILVQLLDKLTGVPSRLQVLSIVRMGGIGKTTLATNAFRHPLIVQHLDVCLWATISQQYNVVKILKQLLSIDEYTSGTVDELGERLYKSLCGQRYMIILDDMWSVEAWDEIKFFFPDTHNGSRIVVTTRHFDVASHKGFSWLLISCLDADNSWDLFCQKAFEAEQECPSQLEEIGRKIVEKCKGLPLAIVVVGGHFRNSSMTREYWENVEYRINLMLDSTVDDEHCLKVLCSSYSYLPVHLKPCFLSLGAFQEDEKIYVGDVVKLWIGEGLVESFEDTGLEEVARSYVRDLLRRNLISLGKLDHNADVFTFTLHGLLRELCIKISQEEEFLHVRDTPRGIDREHRDLISAKFPVMNHQRKFLRALNKIDALTTSDESIFQQVSLRYLII